MNRINLAIGNIRIDRIQPQHLISFYNNLEESEIREDVICRSVLDIKDILKEMRITQKQLVLDAKVSITVIY